MRRKILSIALIAAGMIGGASPLVAADGAVATKTASAAAISVPDPAQQLTQLARLFRAGDVATLVRTAIPPARWEEMQLAYELAQLEPISDHDRAEFAEKLEQFTAPDAVDRLMAEIEPKFAEARPQAPGAILMGIGALQVAINKQDNALTDEQRDALRAALPAFAAWAQGTDFLDIGKARQALTLLVEATRRTGITDVDQLRSLPLESVLDHGSALLAAGKQAVRLYGIDLDQIADTLRVETLSIDGDTARVRTTVTVFDAPLSIEHDLVLIEGRWYGRDAARHFGARLSVNVD